MFKDDRLISILSGVILMIAIGTVVQRGGPLVEMFGETDARVLVSDTADARVGVLTRIDVLSNDSGLRPRDRDRLRVVDAPECGRVFVQERALQYLPTEECSGPQSITYAIGADPDAPTATVLVSLRGPSGEALSGVRQPVPRPSQPPAASEVPPEEPVSAPAVDGVASARNPALTGRAPDPVRRFDPSIVAVPDLKGLDLDSVDLSLAQPAPRVGAGTPPIATPEILAGPELRAGLDGLRGAEPVAQPSQTVMRAPVSITEQLGDARNNDFVASQSRGGLLSRPSRAQTQATPTEGALASVAQPDPVSRGPVSQWTPSTLSVGAAPASPAHELDTTPDFEVAERPNQPVSPSLSQPQQPSGIAQGSGISAPAAPGLPGRTAPPTGPRPSIGAPPSPPALRGQPTAPQSAPTEPERRVAQADQEDVPEAPEPRVQTSLQGGLELRERGIDRVARLGLPSDEVIARSQRVPSVSLAEIDRTPDGFVTPELPGFSNGSGLSDSRVPRVEMPSIASNQGERLALAPPEAGLGDIRNLGSQSAIRPVEIIIPSALGRPEQSDIGIRRPAPAPQLGSEAEAESFDPDAPAFDPDAPAFDPDAPAFDPDAPAFDPDQPAGEPGQLARNGSPTNSRVQAGPSGTGIQPGVVQPGVQPGIGGTQLARRSESGETCLEEPSFQISASSDGITSVSITAPCFAERLIRLRYYDIELSQLADSTGRVVFGVPGFERSTLGRIVFPDGTTIDTELPFFGTERFVRVALIWDAPVTLELHARARSKPYWSEGHFWPERPGNGRDARRLGSGYLTAIDSRAPSSASMRVYTHYIRATSRPEVIELMVDYASRRRVGARETCGDGPYAAPRYRVMRSEFGVMQRERRAVLGALDCDDVADFGDRLDDAAVRDIVVLNR